MARHASLAEQLGALKAYSQRPEIDAPIDTLKTNWSAVEANDNSPEEIMGMSVERRLRIRPTDTDIVDETLGADVVRGPDVYSDHFGRMIPGPILRIGNVRFSNGTHTEKAYTYGLDGKLTQFDARMPLGAMLGATEKQERMLGGDDDTSERNAMCARIVSWLGSKRSRSMPKRERDKTKDKNYTVEESRKMLAEAMANTDPAKVSWTRAHKAMPWKPSNSTELFLGMVKTTKGESGSVAWQDIVGHITEREVWAKSIDALKPESRATIAALETAQNTAAIGMLHGKRGSQAWAVGKAKLIAANDDLMAAINKVSA